MNGFRNPPLMIVTEFQISDILGKKLQFIATRQIPFAIATSLTATAKQAQSHVRNHISETFTIRRKNGGFVSSIAIKPATKKNLTAEVYTMARFAALQQIGGMRQPRGSNLAIPFYKNLSEVKTKRSARQDTEAFEIKLRNGHPALVRRKGKDLQFLYFLHKQANIPKRFRMVEIVTATVRQEFEQNLKNKLYEV